MRRNKVISLAVLFSLLFTSQFSLGMLQGTNSLKPLEEEYERDVCRIKEKILPFIQSTNRTLKLQVKLPPYCQYYKKASLFHVHIPQPTKNRRGEPMIRQETITHEITNLKM